MLRYTSNTSTSFIHKFKSWSRRVEIVPLITSISHQKLATVKGTMTVNRVWRVIYSWNAAELEDESLISISISISISTSISISRPGVDVTAVSSIVLQELHHAHRLIGGRQDRALFCHGYRYIKMEEEPVIGFGLIGFPIEFQWESGRLDCMYEKRRVQEMEKDCFVICGRV